MNPMVSVRVEGEREEEDPAVSAILSLGKEEVKQTNKQTNKQSPFVFFSSSKY